MTDLLTVFCMLNKDGEYIKAV